jgi:EAL domain-containing protein (putative c-di-GMP-specific phosphodiesterase class I)
MHVVCEGVETAEQHNELTRLDCDSCQGFYFARPMSAASLAALIRTDSNAPGLRLPAPATGIDT